MKDECVWEDISNEAAQGCFTAGRSAADADDKRFSAFVAHCCAREDIYRIARKEEVLLSDRKPTPDLHVSWSSTVGWSNQGAKLSCNVHSIAGWGFDKLHRRRYHKESCSSRILFEVLCIMSTKHMIVQSLTRKPPVVAGLIA